MNPIRSIGDSKERALASLRQAKNDTFGSQQVYASADSDLGKKVTEFVHNSLEELLSEHPDGSIFLRSTITVHPKVKFRFSDLRSLFEGPPPLVQEVGKVLNIGNLVQPLFGTFTDKDIPLELRNIHFPAGAAWQPNEWTEEKICMQSKAVSINGVKTIGDIDDDPNLKTIEIIADIRFGDYEAKDQVIRAQTRDNKNLELTVALPKLDRKGIIGEDGSVTLENGAQFPIQELIGYDTENIWIDIEYDYDLEFKNE